MESEALRIAGRSQQLDDVAERLLANIQAELLPHNKTGEVSRSFHIESRTSPEGVEGRYVYSDHHAIVPINDGHRAPDNSWVEGLDLFAPAVAKTIGGL